MTESGLPMRARTTMTHRSDRFAQAGVTLVETMIAMTIGLLLLATLSQVFVSNSAFRRELDRSGRLVENASYAMERLSDDLRAAGYYAEFDIGAAGLPLPETKPDPCSTDLDQQAAALPLAIQGYDQGIGLPPSCTSGEHAALRNHRAGADILVVRRADSCVAGPTAAAGCAEPIAGVAYFQASHCTWAPPYPAGELAGPGTGWFKLEKFLSNLNMHNIDCNMNPGGPVADYHRYIVDIYFVSNDDIAGDGIPTLKRARLDASGFTDASVIPLAEGIQDLQIEYGLDTGATPDGSADAFTADPDTYGGCGGAASPCSAANWAAAVAVRVYLLGRNNEPTATGYTDSKNFTLGRTADGGLNTIPAFNDKFKRHVYQASVRLFNPSGRNQ
jgi:type IV pilus assembly protein PilW